MCSLLSEVMASMDIEEIDGLKVYVLAEDYAGYNSPFLAQHGISFLIEGIEYDKRILFDTASYADPILFNMRILGIDPKTIDMIVLSHSHFDHTGGLSGIMRQIRRSIPIIAHPNIFKASFSTEPRLLYAGIPLRGGTKYEIEELGGKWILSRDPIKLAPWAFTLGELKKEEKVDFEREVTIGLYKVEGGRVLKDEVEEEIGLGIATERGLVVFAGCSHPGIVSMVKKAIKLSNYNIYAVIGGFHLIESGDERIRSTVRALKELGVEKIYTGHCTGLKAESVFLEEFGENFERLHAGKIITVAPKD